MGRLLVKNFGPVKNSGSQWIDTRKVTVFCGTQGSGKSTVVKLISEFCWLEKALNRDEFGVKELTTYDRFKKKYCAFHNIQNYFRPESEIRYQGEYYNFEYADSKLTVTPVGKGTDYIRPQIVYIPAERNLLNVLEDTERIKKLPGALSMLLTEYVNALRSLDGVESLPLSGNYSVQYDKLNKITWLRGSGFRVRVSESASGFQSLLPVVLVSRYLQGLIIKGMNGGNLSKESLQEVERRDATIKKLLDDKTLDDDTRLSLIKQLSSNTRNGRLINIVEELEQNLYPASQRQVLYELLKINNETEGNQLLLTTHSPYLINYLSLAVKAGNLSSKAPVEELQESIDAVVPHLSQVCEDQVVIYELTETGEIHPLNMLYGVPSDDNFLNDALGEANDDFDDLMDVEDRMLCRK